MGIPHPEQHAYKHHDEKCNLEEKNDFFDKRFEKSAIFYIEFYIFFVNKSVFLFKIAFFIKFQQILKIMIFDNKTNKNTIRPYAWNSCRKRTCFKNELFHEYMF